MFKLEPETLGRLLAPYGLAERDVSHLGGGREDSDGIVYSFVREGRAMAVKILGWKEPEEAFAWTRRRMEERVSFSFFLGEGGAPVVNAVRDGDGLVCRHSHFEGCGYMTYLMRRVEGTPPGPELWSGELLGQWGAAVGKMHALAARYGHWRHSPDAGPDGGPLLGWRVETRGFHSWCRDDEIKTKWAEMESKLDALPVERGGFGFIHNDPHNHNVLWDGRALRVIDFDVANYHWFAADIAIALQPALFAWGGLERPVQDRDAVLRFLDGFLKGYERENTLERRWLDLVDLFVQYRRMLLFTVMQDWLEANPGVRESWKNMMREAPAVIAPL